MPDVVDADDVYIIFATLEIYYDENTNSEAFLNNNLNDDKLSCVPIEELSFASIP